MTRSFAIATALFFCIKGISQKSPVSFSLEGNVNRTIFDITLYQVSAFNGTSQFSSEGAKPIIKNTIGFSLLGKVSKPICGRLEMTTAGGFNMQQLSLFTGLRRVGTAGPISAARREDIEKVLPRLQLEWGLYYDLLKKESTQLLVGASAGQMIKLSEDGYSYSFLKSGITYGNRNFQVSLSGSYSPYDLTMPNMHEYLGNWGAEQVIGSYAFRITELSLGIACKF